ncbi:protein KINESIN LIGHT CHAIN-RELATED 1 [Amaranthus tricolor]|uniref:protein KINESIN LIGHT CHAIN-RELATED 1 n=1 Tax=Amaranthus tricolor TaxID=29722 RepID=UPI00258A0796|nr:protein KINESIN LIGHT CHAIN-RELATED 1 [Amaranthus tricolor]XP_057517652.1 protein KINESIN LIGHT CHAIN-RELATED 1 [Amaranthus tricolor]
MRRASFKFLHVSKLKSSTTPIISRLLTTQISSTSASTNQSTTNPSFSSSTHVNFPPKLKGLLFSSPKTHQFQKNPSQNFSTRLINPSKLPSRQRKITERAQIEEEFEEAKTAEEMLEAFKEMEANFDEKDLGLASLKIALQLEQEGADPEKIQTYANRALSAVSIDDKNSLPVAMTLQLLGSTNLSLKKYNDALIYLNKANKMLIRLEEEGNFKPHDIKPIQYTVYMELANTMTAMDRREEGLENLKKSVEIKEFLLGKDSKEVGNAYRDLAEAYVAILNFKEGLPYCLKALEVHKEELGNNSVEVAHDRRLLGVIYTGMDQHEKALEQNQLAQKVLKNWGRTADLLRAEIDAANMHVALGKYDAAINTLKSAVQQTEKGSENRALIFITMAKALVCQNKYPDAKRCLEISCGILDKKEKSKPLEVSEAYMEMSMQYETMNEFEIAVSLLKRALALLEMLPQEQHSAGSVSSRIGWLLLLTGKVTQAIPYLESAAETLKESFGSKHFGVAYIYNNLGAAYMELERPESAAQMFAVAKDIMDVALGPHHADTIDTCQNMSKAYAAMGSYPLAIEIQQKAVDAWHGHGVMAQDALAEAIRVLDMLKMKALGVSDSLSEASTTNALPLPQSSDPTRSLQPNRLPNTPWRQ